jgi:hypothetical protein
METPLEHFIRLAKRGKHPAASGGETRSWQLAFAFLENLYGLDDDAIAGMYQFMQKVRESPEEARTLLDAWD